ncbi:protein kinase domain-containing protein [Nannocystis pusilla]|uniref:protein kinase domain-containing protein n=1 Tax=Nannocystis pusilla TaxID=889268 RepID=UPI003B7B6D3B
MIEQKVRLLEKIHLMVQIAEAVAWLHGEKKVVHKDLAPDNIMIRHAPGDLRGAAFADEPVTRQLDQAANLCTEICVIDFGLSDKETLTRSWYEDADTSMATTKLPYLSPEARHRRQAIGCQLDFDAPQSRFRVPDSLEQSAASVYEHDLIADPHDYLHERDIVIQKIDGQPGHRHAYFSGTQPNTNGRHLEIVRPSARPTTSTPSARSSITSSPAATIRSTRSATWSGRCKINHAASTASACRGATTTATAARASASRSGATS